MVGDVGTGDLLEQRVDLLLQQVVLVLNMQKYAESFDELRTQRRFVILYGKLNDGALPFAEVLDQIFKRVGKLLDLCVCVR